MESLVLDVLLVLQEQTAFNVTLAILILAVQSVLTVFIGMVLFAHLATKLFLAAYLALITLSAYNVLLDTKVCLANNAF
jgi:uncharacterized membrane protein (DUF485 family)